METKSHLVLVAIDGNKETYRVMGGYATITWESIYRTHRGTKGQWRAVWPEPAVQEDADCKWLNAERRRITQESAIAFSAQSRKVICVELSCIIPSDLIPIIDFHLGAACWLKGYHQAPILTTDICSPEYVATNCTGWDISGMKKSPNILNSPGGGVPEMYEGIRSGRWKFLVGFCDGEEFANIIPQQRIFLVIPDKPLCRIIPRSTLFHILQQKWMTLKGK